MAQTGYTPILTYSSSTAAAVPTAGSLTNSTLGSELAINITDGKLFYKDNANNVQVIGWKVVPATAGGTGQTSYAVGDILYADTTTSLAKLPDVATGNALISGGVGVAPAWGKIGLTTHVTGTLPVANGGTGTATAFTTGSVVFAGASGVYSQNNANLFWDNTNNRLGIGTATPQSALSFVSNSVISVATLDGSDNGIIALTGGGAAATTRGGFVECRGNEALLPGIVDITSGNVANSYVSIQGRSASSYIRFATNATEAMRIFSSQGVSIGDTTDPSVGNLRLGTGNLVIGTSGKGIDFSATPGTGTSELLDDYEEGTWTPVLTFATAGNLSVAYSTQTGNYVKVGRLVTATCSLTTSTFTHTTASGDLRITGIPFTAATAHYSNLAFNGINKTNYTTVAPRSAAGSSTLTFIASGMNQSASTVKAADMPTAGTVQINFTLCYETDS